MCSMILFRKKCIESTHISFHVYRKEKSHLYNKTLIMVNWVQKLEMTVFASLLPTSFIEK